LEKRGYLLPSRVKPIQDLFVFPFGQSRNYCKGREFVEPKETARATAAIAAAAAAAAAAAFHW